MEKACLQAIKIKYDSLTAAEKKIADYISKNSEKVTKMTAEELSENCGTAKSAVVRCCKSLGYDGYSDFKISFSTSSKYTGRSICTTYYGDSFSVMTLIVQNIFTFSHYNL